METFTYRQALENKRPVQVAGGIPGCAGEWRERDDLVPLDERLVLHNGAIKAT